MKKVLLALVLVSVLSLQAQAVTNLTANDGIGTTSFNAAGKWSDGLAPYAGNTYSTVGYLLRTPGTAGSYTFAGDSLTVGGGSGNPFLTDGNVNNNALISKTPGTTTVITVNNLILDAGYIRDGQGSDDVWSVAGNIFVTANGGGFANQCRLNVDSAISGSGTLYIADNGSGEEARTTYIRSAMNTYNGSIILRSKDGRANANYSRLTFTDDSMMNFVIGAAGVNNSISGNGTAIFNGDFNFDLSGASANLGDQWTIVSATSKTFSDTFTVVGFTNAFANSWLKSIDGTLNYKFNANTGILSVVPEPASMLLLGLGGLLISYRKR